MDILEDGFRKGFNRFRGNFPALRPGLGGRSAHRHRAGHAVGNPDVPDRLFVVGQGDVHRAAQGGDIHGLPHGVFDIVAGIAFISGFGDEDGSLDLSRPQIHFAGFDVEFRKRNPADALRAGQLHDGVPGHQRGRGVGAGHAVAGVAADGADIPDLGAAHEADRLAQHRDELPDDRGCGDVGETGQGADADRAFFVEGHAAHRVDAVDAHQFLAGAFALPDLDQDVAAAGNDLGFRVLLQQADRVFDALRFIQRFYVIHSRFLLFRALTGPV